MCFRIISVSYTHLDVYKRQDCNRQNAVENDTVMLNLCKKYQVPVVMDSDAHFDLLIGEFDLARDLLEKLDFPEELVLNRSADAIREYVNRKF